MDINNLKELIKNQLPLSISETNFDIGKRYKGFGARCQIERSPGKQAAQYTQYNST